MNSRMSQLSLLLILIKIEEEGTLGFETKDQSRITPTFQVI